MITIESQVIKDGEDFIVLIPDEIVAKEHLKENQKLQIILLRSTTN
ncbi:MAG: hypothetical protein WC595_03250 [Candidatus Nanoarchaeia archaeon]